MITLNCPGCAKPLRVKDDLRGRRIKCPECGQVCTAGGVDSPPAEPPAAIPFDDSYPAEPPAPRRRAAPSGDGPRPTRTAPTTPGGAVRRYRLVCRLNAGAVAKQTIVWVLLSLVTCGFALPFFAYFFWKLVINATEIVAADGDEDGDEV